MRYRGMGGLLAALLLAACSPATPPAPAVAEDPAYAAAQQQWRVARYQDLTRPDGWTALVGLHWLPNRSHFVGSGATNGIRLAVGPDKLGLLRREGSQWWFTPEAGAEISHDGQPVRGRIRIDTDKDPQPTLLAFDGGKGQLGIIRRGPRDALRVKHADAPARRDFAGLEYWPGGPDWQVQARFIAHPPGKTLPIVDITGLTTEMPNAGAVEFERDGRAWRLEAIGAPGQPLFLIFADRTSGRGSYPAGRYLDTDAPGADGTVRIDFNHAYNPPCAFTAYATCPLAPPENRLDLRVEAGEKAYTCLKEKAEMPIRLLFRATLLLAACAIAPLALARNAPAADDTAAGTAKPPVPLLWKVTGPGDARVYLLGSFHLLKPQDYPLSPDVEQAFEASQRVVFELSPEDMQSPQLASRMVQAAVRTDGSELKRDLDAATWQKLQVFATENKLPLAQMQGMKPWFVGLSISVGQMQKMGLDPALGLDRHFMERAQKTGRKTAGLEDIDTQIGMLDGMTVQEQRQMLSEALDQAGKGDEQARQLHDAWRRGDERVLWNRMAAEMRQQYPQLYQRINTGRNDAWVPKLLPYLQAGQGGTLVVVGTLHLLGNDGVVEKLKAKGYKVERVCTGCKAKR